MNWSILITIASVVVIIGLFALHRFIRRRRRLRGLGWELSLEQAQHKIRTRSLWWSAPRILRSYPGDEIPPVLKSKVKPPPQD